VRGDAERKEQLFKASARRMRHNPTDAEWRLWDVLRSRQLQNYKFRRQHKIGPYIADFACISHKLVVEADGSQHANNAGDTKRTDDLKSWGWQVMHFWNPDILANTEGVQEMILAALKGRQKNCGYIPDILELVKE
jgi:primosomal protein N' (replication factor Y)